MAYSRKDFISLLDINDEEILYILETAETMKYILNQKNKKAPYLQGKSVIILFYEKSVRAKLSYELAAQYLSADIVDITVSKVSDQYETINDMGRTIEQMGGDFIICRHPMAGSAKFLSENVHASVINAGDGINEDPSQSLLDLMTIKNQKGSFKGLKVAIIGDVAHSRVTRSNIWGLLKLGAEVCVAGPPTMIPSGIEQFGVKVFYNTKDAIDGADVVMTMRLDTDKESKCRFISLDEYQSFFKIDANSLANAQKDVIVMHPGPVNRGIEISSQLLDDKRCLLDDQITNGVAVRMALLYILSNKVGATL